jgi:hypothetical protein
VEPDDLPDPEDLWWSWATLAAIHRAGDEKVCTFDPGEQVLRLDLADGGWLRMQRALGSRMVLWGRSAQVGDRPPDPRREAPDWAVTDAAGTGSPSFLAWHVHGEWDLSGPEPDEGAVHLLRPLLSVDPRAVEALRADPCPETLRTWTDGPHLEEAVALLHRVDDLDRAAGSQGGAVLRRLRQQIHEQMRAGQERDRVLIQRPPLVVYWSRANGPQLPYEHAVMAVRGELRPAPTNTALPPLVERTLTNVLLQLHREEASDESGAWLFARVWSEGSMVSFDRAFDTWPEWYQVRHTSQGPSLEDLAWEMAQRSPEWRPAWSTLLPPA